MSTKSPTPSTPVTPPQPPPRQPRSALVTGSAKGIGAAIARHLAAKGIAVAIQYHGSKTLAEAVLADCRKTAPASLILQADLTDETSANTLCTAAESAFGGVDLLVNNVGNYVRKDILDLSFAEWRDQIESNLYTTFLTCRALIPAMNSRGFGRVVNIGYAGCTHPFYNRKTVPYHIAKTGVSVLTRCLAPAAAPHGVTVNTIGIGVIENSISIPKHLPSGRTGTFADVCNALDFFINPSSSYVNGTQLDVSGGWLPEQVI